MKRQTCLQQAGVKNENQKKTHQASEKKYAAHKPWELEVQTEGLDENQPNVMDAEAKENKTSKKS